jgi:hypothetical protein
MVPIVTTVVLLAPAIAAAQLEPSGPPLAPTIGAAATWARIAPELLVAVTWVESRGHAWVLRIGGHVVYPNSHAEAVALARAIGARADIGLAQIHYPIWGPVFGLRPEDLLDPWTNLHVAAAILRYAMDQEPDSWGGVGRYHSATPWRKWSYARHVATVFSALRAPAFGPARAPHP